MDKFILSSLTTQQNCRKPQAVNSLPVQDALVHCTHTTLLKCSLSNKEPSRYVIKVQTLQYINMYSIYMHCNTIMPHGLHRHELSLLCLIKGGLLLSPLLQCVVMLFLHALYIQLLYLFQVMHKNKQTCPIPPRHRQNTICACLLYTSRCV